MAKDLLKEALFNHLTESVTSSPEAAKVTILAEQQVKAAAVVPPDAVWLGIQKKIHETPVAEDKTFAARFKAIFSPPLLPALALGLAGILVGAFMLINRGTTPQQTPLVELSKAAPKNAGDTVIAKGLRIENSGGGTISHTSGSSEKIILESGTWKMALVHKELEKPVQFIFPGGALESLGTVFTIGIRKDGTDINLSEGKIRLYKYQSGAAGDAKNKWQSNEISAPHQETLPTRTLEINPVIEPAPVVKKTAPSSKFSGYVGISVSIEMKNGDRLSGKLLRAAGGRLMLSGASGNLSVREIDILRLQRN